jgi:hypothetical protein
MWPPGHMKDCKEMTAPRAAFCADKTSPAVVVLSQHQVYEKLVAPLAALCDPKVIMVEPLVVVATEGTQMKQGDGTGKACRIMPEH